VRGQLERELCPGFAGSVGSDELVRKLRAADAPDGFIKRPSPSMLHEQTRDRPARLQSGAQLAHKGPRRAVQRALSLPRARGVIEAESNQLADHAGRAPAERHSDQLSGAGLATDEQRVEESEGSAAFYPLERGRETALECRAGRERECQELARRVLVIWRGHPLGAPEGDDRARAAVACLALPPLSASPPFPRSSPIASGLSTLTRLALGAMTEIGATAYLPATLALVAQRFVRLSVTLESRRMGAR